MITCLSLKSSSGMYVGVGVGWVFDGEKWIHAEASLYSLQESYPKWNMRKKIFQGSPFQGAKRVFGLLVK